MHIFSRTVASRITLLALVAFGIAHSSNVLAANADMALTRYINGLNAAMPPMGNPANAANLFAADARQVHVLAPPTEKPLTSREEIRQFFAGFKDFFADWTHIEKSRVTRGNSAVWEGVATGHHRESGKPITLPIVFFLEFDNDGAVREVRVYADGRSIGDQLQ